MNSWKTQLGCKKSSFNFLT